MTDHIGPIQTTTPEVIDLTGPDETDGISQAAELKVLSDVAAGLSMRLTLGPKGQRLFESCWGRSCQCDRKTAAIMSRIDARCWLLTFGGAESDWQYRAQFQLPDGKAVGITRGQLITSERIVAFDCYGPLCDGRPLDEIPVDTFGGGLARLQVVATSSEIEIVVYQSCWIRLATTRSPTAWPAKRPGGALLERPAKRARVEVPVKVVRQRSTLADRLSYYKHLVRLTDGRDKWAIQRCEELAAELLAMG